MVSNFGPIYHTNISTKSKNSSTLEGFGPSPVTDRVIVSRSFETTKEDRVKIPTALDPGVPVAKIAEQFGFTKRQIYYVRSYGLESGRKSCGRKPAVLAST
uniref:Secreted effector protein n=1 Tax=Oidium heveae TaxID=299130 RepID=A0A977R8U9_OIDHE|nr:putative secreted effector protein [Oidium heveae]